MIKKQFLRKGGKRVLSIMLGLAMIAGSVGMNTTVVKAANFAVIEAEGYYTVNSGTYDVTENKSTDGRMTKIAGNKSVTLNMNGHTIDAGNTSWIVGDYTAGETNSLTLNGPGTFTSAYNTMQVQSNGTFTARNGVVVKGTQSNRRPIMYGGNGVYIKDSSVIATGDYALYPSANYHLSGRITISGHSSYGDILFGYYSHLNIDEKITPTSPIKLVLYHNVFNNMSTDPLVLTTGMASTGSSASSFVLTGVSNREDGYAASGLFSSALAPGGEFTFNSNTYKFGCYNGELVIAKQGTTAFNNITSSFHDHSWTYSASGNTLTATCTTGCAVNSGSLSRTLTANDATYTGVAYTGASVAANSNWTEANDLALPGTIQYYSVDTAGATTGGTLLTSSPVDVGNYYATVTVTDSSNSSNTATAVKAFKITPKALTVTANDKTITYGEEPANDGVSFTGFVNNETASVLGGTLSYSYNYEQYGNAGTYAITPSGYTSDNYNITFAAGTLTVSPKAITADASKIAVTTKTYDGTTSAAVTVDDGALNSSDFENGDEIGISATGTFADANEGTGKTVTLALTGAKKNNYNLTTTVTGTIEKKAVTVKAKDQKVAQSGSITTGTGQITFTPALATGDAADSVMLVSSSTDTYTTGGTITPSNLVIKKGSTTVTSNYELTYSNGRLVVVPTAVSASNVAPGPDGFDICPSDTGLQYTVVPFGGDPDNPPSGFTPVWVAGQGDSDPCHLPGTGGSPLTPGTIYGIYNRDPGTGDETSEPSLPTYVATKPASPTGTIGVTYTDTTITVSPVNAAYEYIVAASGATPPAYDADWTYGQSGSNASSGKLNFTVDKDNTALTADTEYVVYSRVKKVVASESNGNPCDIPASDVCVTPRTVTTRRSAPTTAPTVSKSDTSVTITNVDTDLEYIVLKSSDGAPSESAWANSIKPEDTENITFDGLTPGTAYVVYARKKAVSEAPAKEAGAYTTTSITTEPKHLTGVNISATTESTELQFGMTMRSTLTPSNAGGTFVYQWRRSENGTDWTNITGATSSTYTIVEADIGKYLSLAVTQTDGANTVGTICSSATADTVEKKDGERSFALSTARNAEVTNNTIVVKNIDPDLYEYQVSEDGENWITVNGSSTPAGTGNSSNDTFTITGLTASTSYEIRVRRKSTSTVKEGEWSSPMTVTTLDRPTLTGVYTVNVTSGATNNTITYGDALPTFSLSPGTISPTPTNPVITYYYSQRPFTSSNPGSTTAPSNPAAGFLYVRAVITSDDYATYETNPVVVQIDKKAEESAGITITTNVSVEPGELPTGNISPYNSSDKYEYIVKVSGATAPTAGAIGTTITPDRNGNFSIPGLTPGQNYKVYVRKKAADGNHTASAWIASDAFTAPATFTVVYDLNGGKMAGGAALDEANGDTANSVAAELDTDLSKVVRTGYVFEGWTEVKDSGSGVSTTSSGTVYAKWRPITYDIVFNGNGSTSGSTAAMTNRSYGQNYTLTNNGFSRDNYTFIGWATSESNASSGLVSFSNQQSVKNLTAEDGATVNLYAVWVRNTYSVSVAAYSGYSENMTLTLKRGAAQISQQSNITLENAGGRYTTSHTFTNVPNGIYNLVAVQTVAGGHTLTMTVKVEISGSNQNVSVTMPEGFTNSKLDVTGNAPNVMVGSLDVEAAKEEVPGSDVTVEMKVSNADESTEGAKSIVNAAGNASEVDLMDIDLTKTIKTGTIELSQPMTETDTILEIIIPFDTTGKFSIRMFRNHGDATSELSNSANGAEGTFRIAGNFIHLYAKFFSTYAISYTTDANAAGNNGGGSYSNGSSYNSSAAKTDDIVRELMDRLGVDRDTAVKMGGYAEEYGVSLDEMLLDENAVLNMTSDKDPTGSTYRKLMAGSAKRSTKSVTLNWKEVEGADGYLIFGNKCGTANKMKLLKTLDDASALTWKQTKLEAGTYYKYLVLAYKNVGDYRMTLAASKVIHLPTKGNMYSDVKSIKVYKNGNNKANKNETVLIKAINKLRIKIAKIKNDELFAKTMLSVTEQKKLETMETRLKKLKNQLKSSKAKLMADYRLLKTDSISLAEGSKTKILGIETADDKNKPFRQHRQVKYESSDPKTVKVSSKGTVKAVKKGTATVYIYAQNGVCKQIEVTVK